jgi:phosphonate degradation associated HDIG domain protein
MWRRQGVFAVDASRASSLAEVVALLRHRGDRRYDGEPVSHREHALQCASLALQQGEEAALVAACLLHDVGHLLDARPGTPTLDGVDDRHELRGPAWLGALFPAAVLQPVRWHVDAKRFLAATEPAYLESLSADSRRSLVLQGGPMSVDEQAVFLARPGAVAALRLRRLDEAAKQPGLATLPMETLTQVLEHCMRGGD